MTRNSFSLFSIIVTFAVTLAAAAEAAPTLESPVKPVSPLKTDSAEFCTSIDGRLEVIRDFNGGETYVVLAPSDAVSKPVFRSGFKYVKQPGGVVKKNEVTFEMFELMVEPFDNEPKDQKRWSKTYEEIFDGKVTLIDDKGKTVATIAAICHAAVVDFK